MVLQSAAGAAPQSRLGFGVSGPLALPIVGDARVGALLARVLESGFGLIDVAGFYGGGRGERRLGRALSRAAKRPLVSTKVGTRVDALGRAGKDFSRSAIVADLEASLRRLNIEAADIVYLHGPSPAETLEGLEALSRCKESGKARLIGVCTHGEHVDAAIDAGAEAIMSHYNFLVRDNAPRFQRARARGLHVAAIAPLAQAIYADEFNRVRRPADLWKVARARRRAEFDDGRRAALRGALRDAAPDRDPASAALAFALDNPDVDVAVVTTSNPRHLEGLIAAAGAPLSDGERAAMAAIAVA